MPGKCIQNLEKKCMVDHMSIKLFLFSTAVKDYTYFFLGPSFSSQFSIYDRVEPQQWPPESLRPQYQGWGSWRSGCRRRKVCWSRYQWAGTSKRTKHEKMLKRTWQKGSTGTEWCPPSPPRAGRPSLPRGLLPWTEQSGVWLAGQGKPGHTKRFVWSLACRNITEKILKSPKNLFSHRAGSTNMPVQLLSTSKKSVFESEIRSSAPASMKNPLCNFDLKITWSRKISWPPWLKLR